jgi:hypothetical protein
MNRIDLKPIKVMIDLLLRQAYERGSDEHVISYMETDGINSHELEDYIFLRRKIQQDQTLKIMDYQIERIIDAIQDIGD